ncbi:AAA family ATPase [Cohnella suwonensis]|uniref:AAA family ATPase n=1 Tax=Cohnella suwonensis TaxID=696072 RepID=A0ABW0LVH1_9BACL
MIRIHLLGNFKLLYEDKPITSITGGNVLLLLAYLLLNRNSPQSRKYVSFLFWPDSTEKQALTNLRNLYHQLRKCLPDADRYLVADALSLKWNPDSPYLLDMEDFERSAEGSSLHDLKRAIELYAGPLLPGSYDDWIESERERLQRLYQASLERLVSKLETNRLYLEAISYSERLISSDNLKEEYYRILMRLHALNNDITGLAKIYNDCTNTLKKELGIQPSDVTYKLYHSLMQEETDPAFHQMADAAPFVGRHREWESLLSVWRSPLANPSFVLLEGEPGIGKTRVAEEFKAWLVKQGISVGFAKCYSAAGGLAFAPITAWLKSRSQRIQNLSPVWLTEIARLMPELSVQHPELTAPGPLTENWQKVKTFDAIEHSLFDHDKPCVLFLDDIQWCDAESLEWLQYLFRQDGKSKIVLVATKRSGEEKKELTALLASLHKANMLTNVRLHPLSNDESKQLASAISERKLYSRLSDKFFEDAGGNPLIVVETMRSLQNTLHDTANLHWAPVIHKIISTRILQLPEQAQNLLHLASVINRPFTLELLKQSSGSDPDTILHQSELLVKQHIFRELGDGWFEFSHDRLRETAYQTLSEVARHRYHEQVAVALESNHEGELDSVAGQIAHHLDSAGMKRRAVPYYKQAAKVAEKVHALDKMSSYYGRLLEIVPETDKHPIVLELGRLREIAGRRDEAQAVYENWLATNGSHLSMQQKAQCKTALGNCLMLKSDYKEALAYLKQAHLEFEWAGDLQGISSVLSVMAILHYYKGDSQESLKCFDRRMAMDSKFGDMKDDSRIAGLIGNIFLEQYDLDKALYWYKEMIRLAKDDKILVSHSLAGLSLVYIHLEQYDKATFCINEKLAHARVLGERLGVSNAVGMLGFIYSKLGDYERMKACYAYAISEACAVGDMRVGAYMLGRFGFSLTRQPDRETSDTLIELSVRYIRKINAPSFLCAILHLQALTMSERKGNDLVALEITEEALDLAIRLKRTHYMFRFTLLQVCLNYNLRRISEQEAWKQYQDLREIQPYLQDQAAIDYECWKRGLILGEQVEAAAHNYLSLYHTTHNEDYRLRFMEMTGQELEREHDFPPLPSEVEPVRVDMKELEKKFQSMFS